MRLLLPPLRRMADRSPSASPLSATAAGISLAVLLARASWLQGRDQGRRLSRSRILRRSCCALASTPPRSPMPSHVETWIVALSRYAPFLSARLPQPAAAPARCLEAGGYRRARCRARINRSLCRNASPSCAATLKAASSSRPAWVSKIRRSCMPSPSLAPILIFSPSIPGGCSRRCSRPSSFPRSATACASGWSAPDAAEVEALVARDGVFGFRQSVDNRKACCEVRKVRPLQPRAERCARLDHRHPARAIERARRCARFAAWDEEHGLIKVNPIADWSTQQLTAYIAENNMPVNPLHARGFVSIGCQPCTRAVQPGEASARRPLVVGE